MCVLKIQKKSIIVLFLLQIFDLLGYNLSLPYESYQEICERKQITLRKLDPETNVRKQLATVRSMFGPEGMVIELN